MAPVWQPEYPNKHQLDRLKLIAEHTVKNGPPEKREAAKGVVATLYWVMYGSDAYDGLTEIFGDIEDLVES